MNCEYDPTPEELYEEAIYQRDMKRASQIAQKHGVDPDSVSDFSEDDSLWQWQWFK